jgi:hypothetical protein
MATDSTAVKWWNEQSKTHPVTLVRPPSALRVMWWMWQAGAGCQHPPAHSQRPPARSVMACRMPAGAWGWVFGLGGGLGAGCGLRAWGWVRSRGWCSGVGAGLGARGIPGAAGAGAVRVRAREGSCWRAGSAAMGIAGADLRLEQREREGAVLMPLGRRGFPAPVYHFSFC